MLSRIKTFLPVGRGKLLFFAAVVAAGVGTGMGTIVLSPTRVLPGVRVAGADVGGLTSTQAAAFLRQAFGHMPEVFVVQIGEHGFPIPFERLKFEPQWEVTAAEALKQGRGEGLIGLVRNIFRYREDPPVLPLRFELDEEQLVKEIKKIALQVEKLPQDARVDFKQKRIVADVAGTKLDREALRKAILQRLARADFSPLETELETVAAKLSAAKLAAVDLTEPLGIFHTTFNPGQKNRTRNIELAAAALNGHVVLPGEVFSYNKVVGPRVASRGFLEAPVIIGGKLVPDEGGGVCQVSSTLFNAVLHAGLEIVKRTPHSRPSAYIAAGRDATVAYDFIDFQFRNDYDNPVVLRSFVSGNKLTVAVYGDRRKARRVEVRRSVLRVFPNKVREIPDPRVPAGKKVVEEKGTQGMEVVLVRALEGPNGQKKQSRFFSRYKPVDRVVRVGVPKEEPKKKEELTPSPAADTTVPNVAPKPAGPNDPSSPG